MLTNSAPVATNSLFSDLTEITAHNGYSAGGSQASISSSTETTGTYKLILGNVVFTASGGTVGPFEYAVLYNNTPTTNSQGATGKPLIAWWDYGSNLTLNDGESFTVAFDGTNGVLQLA